MKLNGESTTKGTNNRVVSPHSIGARRMAMLALHPAAGELKEED